MPIKPNQIQAQDVQQTVQNIRQGQVRPADFQPLWRDPDTEYQITTDTEQTLYEQPETELPTFDDANIQMWQILWAPEPQAPEAQGEEFTMSNNYPYITRSSEENITKVIIESNPWRDMEWYEDEIEQFISSTYSKQKEQRQMETGQVDKPKKGFFDRVGGAIKRAASNIKERAIAFEEQRAKAVEEEGIVGGLKTAASLPWEAVQYAGDVAGWMLGVAWETFLQFVPDEVEQFVSNQAASVIQNFAESNPETASAIIEGLQYWTGTWNELKKQYPEGTDTIESVIKVADVVALWQIGNLARWLKSFIKRAPKEAIAEWAEAVTKAAETAPTGVSKKLQDFVAWGDAQQLITKGINPRISTLTKGKSSKKAFENISEASKSVASRAETIPTDAESHAKAWKEAMDSTWKDIEAAAEWVDTKINGIKIAESIDDYLAKNPAIKTASPNDYKAILEVRDNLAKAWDESISFWENYKQIANAKTQNVFGEADVSNTVKGAYKKVSAEIGKEFDEILSEVPGEFGDLKTEYGRLSSLYDDVWKTAIVTARKRGLPLEEAYSRLEWVGDILGAVGGVFGWKNPLAWLSQGLWKIALWKQLAKLKDADYLIKTWYEKLLQENPGLRAVGTIQQ